jgi:hypothetical protein
MRTILAVTVCLLSLSAHAGEKYLGKIVSGAGADTSNETTASPFYIGKGAKLTLVCNAAALICVDTTTACTATAGSNPGLPVSASEKFPTSVGQVGISTFPTATTGAAAGGAVVRIFGSAAVTCDVFSRDGQE